MRAKLYYLRWSSASRTRDLHILHWGSPKPSGSGFAGGFDGALGNAESMSWAQVFPRSSRHRRLFARNSGIIDSDGDAETSAVQQDVAGGVHLALSALQLTERRSTRSFDAWLQRGRLCHKYELAPSFLRRTVQLKDPRPTTEAATILSDVGLVPDTGPHQLRWNYLEVDQDKERTHGAWMWRAQHFVDSNSGYWTSSACFDALGKHFSAANADRRERELDREETWVAGLLGKIKGMYELFAKDKRERSFYINGGDLDEGRYQGSARRQLSLDVKKARDPVFRAPYVQGFVLPRVPWF